MTRFDFEELRFFAALIHCMRAPRGKGAALWDFKRIGDCAFDGYQAAFLAHLWDGVQQAPGVGMARIFEDGARVGIFDDFAQVHYCDIIGHAGDDAEVVGDEHNRHADVGLEMAHQVQDLGLYRDIEGCRGFVGDEQAGIAREGHCDHGTLAHAA